MFGDHFRFRHYDKYRFKNLRDNRVTENFETVFDVSYQKANNNPDLNHSDFLLPSHRSVITETAS